MRDPVLIHNPDLPDAPPALVDRYAFDDVWSKKGFVLVEKPKAKVRKKKAAAE